ncbi:hypothetical protein [Streptomyces sp. NPDC058382]|uniref:hypothetical protein n=1 Tax=unclassified Streptomyces TaxID=2593676 RepID=UPI00362E0FCD
MSLTADDRLEIHEVIALHGHLSDAGARTEQGWRIGHRKVSVGREAGRGLEPLVLPD